MRIAVLSLLALILAGCGSMPRDPDGIYERVTTSGRLHVGLIDGMTPEQRRKGEVLLARIVAETGAQPDRLQGAAEPLLTRLRAGQLDLVIGPFARSSPWKTMVAFAPPIFEEGKGSETIQLRAALANGENRWIMLVEQASRDVAAGDPRR